MISIPRVTGHLGVGQFATVHKGTWTEDTLSMQVAVKTLTGKTNQADKVKLLQEAAIMMQFNHPNVVQLHGVVKDEDKVKYMHHLHTFIHNTACRIK